jgi:RHH-type transcriptional regulator, rel operon repressor / antitoxin RelB
MYYIENSVRQEMVMSKTMVSARIEDSLDQGLEAIAKMTNRSKSYVIESAIRDLVADKAWMLQEVARVSKLADEDGRFVSEQDMDVWFKSWGSDAVRNLPGLRNRDEP